MSASDGSAGHFYPPSCLTTTYSWNVKKEVEGLARSSWDSLPLTTFSNDS